MSLRRSPDVAMFTKDNRRLQLAVWPARRRGLQTPARQTLIVPDAVQIGYLEGTYEINPEDLNILGHELNKAKNALKEFYMQHRPVATPIEDSPA